MKTVLAFDQAFQNTGWAVGTSDGPVACGLIVVSPRRFDSLGARFLRFEKGIRELLQTHRPALVVFEEHRAHAGVQAAQVLGACSAILMMVAVARKKYPTMHVPDDNVADALHIMAWGLDQL
jgi:Holliday junction resolvasome RuvABC endonuclease subunit